jgi:flavin-dependent dehydrogenase
VIDDLQLDEAEYRPGRTFQAITGFRVGLIGARETVDAVYGRPVSYGIRRCEFDHYLLQRSGARLQLGTPVHGIRRDGGRWIVNESISAAVLVGAGGHFCPVARMLNGPAPRAALVSAQEAEFEIDRDAAANYTVAAERPELYFCRDLKGYGWCFRKQNFLNVGFGRLDARALPKSIAGFVDFLKSRGTVPAGASWRWRGHAYLVSAPVARTAAGDGVLLAGDAAGLASPQSGEGIRPAIESGLLAADTILAAKGRYRREDLSPYETALRHQAGSSWIGERLARAVPDGVGERVAEVLFGSRWFVRHLVLDRWFLQAA